MAPFPAVITRKGFSRPAKNSLNTENFRVSPAFAFPKCPNCRGRKSFLPMGACLPEELKNLITIVEISASRSDGETCYAEIVEPKTELEKESDGGNSPIAAES